MIEFDPKDEGDAMAAGRGIFRELIETLQVERIKAYHEGMRDGIKLASLARAEYSGILSVDVDVSQIEFYKRQMDG